jgi:hypothetical protein
VSRAGAIVVRGAHVLALDDAGHEWPQADLVIDGARIADVGPGATGPLQRA